MDQAAGLLITLVVFTALIGRWVTELTETTRQDPPES
ncbi:MAG: hypothetical protein NBKEAIPA_01954 [Nitrospirae bacterium]|nr:MAG: hypothetical protein UZ03_NOB001002083 [Nitrospira sp. OLB3]MBV6470041.1 hypothetical protein [Nitrospirota bacterium]